MGVAEFSPAVKQRIIEHRYDCGYALMYCNRHAQAILEFEAIMELDPNHAPSRVNRCLALLAIGAYVKGMPEYDWHWKEFEWISWPKDDFKRVLSLPLWQGSRCNLLVHHQEGYGDAVMYMRVLPKLVERCESVTLLIYPEIASLMEGYGAKVITTIPEDCSMFDAQVATFNSLWMTGCVTQQTIPSQPYIPADFKFGGGKMGITWSGVTQNAFTLRRFLSYLNIEGYELFSLQKTTNLPLYRTESGELRTVKPLMSKDFKEIVRLMETLDVIVTVDTSTAHLAGAMGHPNAHVLIPFKRDWRWWHKDWWYPTLKIYPQDDPTYWDAAFDKLNNEIHDPAGVKQLLRVTKG